MPIGCNHLAMFIDVQASLLFYVVAGWKTSFSGYVLDYGAIPIGSGPYFTLARCPADACNGGPSDWARGAIFMPGLETLTGDYLRREWRRDNERCGSSVADQRQLGSNSTDVVLDSVAEPHSAIVMPSHGRFVALQRAVPRL